MKSQKGNVLIIILSIIAVIALILAGYFFLQNQQSTGSGWKIYRSQNNMYEFSYPSDWKTIIGPNEIIIGLRKDELPKSSYIIQITRAKKYVDEKTAREHFLYLIYPPHRINYEANLKDVVINGKDSIRYFEEKVLSGQRVYTDIALIKSGDYFYKIELTTESPKENHEKIIKVFDQILGTFRFLE